jgi:hypothetical protein
MLSSIPPRLRAPAIMLAGGAVITAVAVAAWGWSSLWSVGVLAVAAAIGYYFLAGWLVYREHGSGPERQPGH